MPIGRPTQLILLLCLLLILSATFVWRAQPGARQNVILICLDTVRDDVFWLPESAALSDPLSAWLDLAVRFRNAYAVSPWTIPSLASVMTGLAPQRHGAGRLPGPIHDLSEQLPTGLDSQLPTLAEELARQGYRTVNFSAHPWMTIKDFGLGRGFQEEYQPPTGDLVQEVFRWLLANEADREPFFLNLHFMEAHDWHREPAGVIRHNLTGLNEQLESAARKMAPGPLLAEPLSVQQKFLEYVRAVSYLRGRVALVLAGLHESDLLSRTIVLVYADHGEEFMDHKAQHLQKGDDPRGIYGFGHGHSLYQELLRIPMVAWLPGHLPREVRSVVSLTDIAPTLRTLLELPPAPIADGVDIAPRLDPRFSQPAAQRALGATGIAYGPSANALLLGGWKLIRRYDGSVELFDLDTDPGELVPLQQERTDTVAAMTALIERIEGSRIDSGSPAPTISPEQLERLRALGYISGRSGQEKKEKE